MFPYAIGERPKYKGYPAFRLELMPPKLELPCGTVYSFPLPHGEIDVLGLVFEEAGSGGRIAYFTDCHDVTPEARARARGADVLVIDALQYKTHPSHLSLSEALQWIDRLTPGRAVLTHMHTPLDYATVAAETPENVEPAYDGLVLEIPY